MARNYIRKKHRHRIWLTITRTEPEAVLENLIRVLEVSIDEARDTIPMAGAASGLEVFSHLLREEEK